MSTDSPADPAQRYGWMLWGAWLIFLVFPVLESLDGATPARVVGGLVATAIFAVVYVLGFLGMFVLPHPLNWWWAAAVGLGTGAGRMMFDRSADHDRVRDELVDIQVLTRQVLAEVRATVGGLRAAGIEADLPADVSALDPRHRSCR